MKRFIYLDSMKMNSFMAQALGGQKVRAKKTISDTVAEGVNEPPDTLKASGNAAFKLFGSGINLGLEYVDTGVETTFMQTQSGQEMIEYVVNDEIYNNMVTHLTSIGAVKSEPTLNCFYAVNEKLSFVDMPWTLEMIKKFDVFQKSTMTREQRKAGTVLQPNTKYFDAILDLIDLCLPSTHIVSAPNMVSFLKREYLRVDTASLHMFYDGKVSLMGIVTSLFHGNSEDGLEKEGLNAVLHGVPTLILPLLADFGVTVYEGMPIIDPIALFVED